MFDKQSVLRPCAVSFAIALALGLSACGGGSNIRPSPLPADNPPPPSGSGGQILVTSGTLKVAPGETLTKHIVLANATLDNAGTIDVDLDNAVEGTTYGYPTILNHDGGSIQGNVSALLLKDGGEVRNTSGSLIDGDSLAIGLNSGGDVANDGVGSIISSSEGIAVRVSAILGTGATVENTGGATITGGSTAVYLPYGGEVINGSGSIIETTGTTDGDCHNTGSCSIFIATVDMDGDSSVPDWARQFTLTNAGTIIGNVQMNPAAASGVTLQAGGSIQGNLNGLSSLALDGDADSVQLYSHAVTGTITFAGSRSLAKIGDGTWIIDNDSLSEVHDTVVGAGTLQVGNGGTEGSFGQGSVFISTGSLVFDRSDDVIFGGDIGSSHHEGVYGSLVQAGTGTLILTSRQIDPTTIKIKRGTLQIGNGGAIGWIYSSIENNGSLVLDGGGTEINTLVISDVISGTGSLTKQGTGTAILGFANTYTGGTTVNNGILKTVKFLPGDVIVNAAAVLDGFANSGVMPGFPGVAGNLSNAGTVAVHDGDTSVGADYFQSATGTLAVSLGSKLDVSGTATLDGGTLEVTGADSGYVASIHTDVLTADGGVSGTFDQLVKDTGVVFTATTLNYDTTHVWLDTTGLDVTTAAAGHGVSYTPASMGSAVRVQGTFEQLDQKIAAGDSDSVSGAFLRSAGAFQQSPNLRAAQASLESLSGELHAASAAMTFEAIDASNRALSDRFDALLDSRATAGMWMHDLDVGGNMARSGFDGIGFQLDGWMAGSDRRIGATGVAGFAFGQSRGRQQLDGRADRNRSRSTEGMLYAGWSSGNRYVQGRVGFGHYRQDVSRQLLLGSSYQGVGTDYNGRYDVAYGESGLHFEHGGMQLTPFADLQYARIDRDAFAEQGAGGFGLRAHAQTLDRWQAGLGVRAAHRWDFGDGRSLDFSARVEWQRTLASHGDVFDASFVGVDQWQPLTGVGLSRHSAMFGLGLNAHLSDRTALKFGYDYGRGDRAESNMLTARLAVAF